MSRLSVESFRRQGYSVKVTHHRRYWELDANNRPVIKTYARFEAPVALKYALPTGGYTVVAVAKGDEYWESISICSVTDNFDKTRAITVALGRINKAINSQPLQIARCSEECACVGN